MEKCMVLSVWLCVCVRVRLCACPCVCPCVCGRAWVTELLLVYQFNDQLSWGLFLHTHDSKQYCSVENSYSDIERQRAEAATHRTVGEDHVNGTFVSSPFFKYSLSFNYLICGLRSFPFWLGVIVLTHLWKNLLDWTHPRQTKACFMKTWSSINSVLCALYSSQLSVPLFSPFRYSVMLKLLTRSIYYIEWVMNPLFLRKKKKHNHTIITLIAVH